MDETLERGAADELILAERAQPVAPDDIEPKVYAFDGWGMIPLEF